jgi:CRISPR-associated exonuclease Cas4
VTAFELPDYLPISHLNAFLYCPRRFWIEFVQGEMLRNEFVLEGLLRHERVDLGGGGTVDGEPVMRRVYLYSERLRIAGFADLLEETDGGWRPVEYKRGRMGGWGNDHVQLCAQALCLEERTGRAIPEGAIFYHGNRRRELVPFTPELRAQTTDAIAAIWALLTGGQAPEPIEQPAKWRDCSLEPICLPREVLALKAASGKAGVPPARSFAIPGRRRLPREED